MWEQFAGPGRPAPPRLIRTGTLSKAVGAAGGFVTGPRVLCDFIRHEAKSHLFSTALPPAVAAVAAANLRWIASDAGRAVRDALRETCWRFSKRLVDGLGTDRVPAFTEHPVVPVLLGEPDAAVRAAETLRGEGYFVPAIRPPTVPRGTSRLRVSLSAAHPREVVDELADAVIRACS